ncbi:putative alpha/beta fold family hydrolase [Mytilinidion resinicola]|uniref:Alpha/beta fold family hydrolase n=1 Tax=Mytilinidion resinicola TaxID=574789 RepID=A0A6A6ZAK9_9PEZI|nr:putative alpha/beta fold family hydrolase [Mytilinidion resinicola]KAF2817334.1 putative alpha/beta fold family hydrolase [Mytilinidion resinicola]
MFLDAVAKGVSLFYGVFTLAVFTALAALDGSLTRSITDTEKQGLAAAQRKFWDLASSPFGFKHRFFTLKNGRRLHYMEHAVTTPKNLVVFLHGFPDSWILWERLLASPELLKDSVLVAVDLGGYGGSDNLPDYSAETVLEAMGTFIIGMRDQYPIQNGGRVLVVSHDWGSVVAFRLASEAPQIVDRFIISSAVLPEQIASTAKAHLGSSKQMLHTWLQRPLSVRLLKTAFRTVTPLLSQARKSGYIVVFHLPQPLSNFAGRMGGRWFLRLLHKLSRRPGPAGLSSTEAAECMAATLGPAAAQLGTVTEDGLAYPESVKQRLHDGGWSEKIRIYREGLFRGKWEKSLEMIVRLSELDDQSLSRRSSSGTGLFEDGPPGSLQAPVTLVYGKKDPAFERRLALEGISDYLTKQSQVVVIEEGGHWLPVEKIGADALEQIVIWALEGEGGALKSRLGEMVTIEK